VCGLRFQASELEYRPGRVDATEVLEPAETGLKEICELVQLELLAEFLIYLPEKFTTALHI
jgi:hypothetical protein